MIHYKPSIDFSLCDKKQKSCNTDICNFMGIRYKWGCFCIIDAEQCRPYSIFIQEKDFYEVEGVSLYE
jgi:hypothetical protein